MESDYKEYVTDEIFLEKYNAYQKKFRVNARECDKILIGMVADVLRERDFGQSGSARPMRLLDIGCSTGNFLLHLRRLMPKLSLVGGDLAESSLEECRRNPQLEGVSFEKLDLFAIQANEAFDIIVVNAVLYMMTDEQFGAALDSIRGALLPGGAILVFDFFHPFEQRISIVERSDSHPDGLPIAFRPQSLVTGWMQEHGFRKIVYRPFTLPIDLARSDDPGLPTYTVKTADGVRLPFRGTLFQPWCHMSAMKG